MARTYKARTHAIDNQNNNGTTGRVTSQERTILGALPPDTSTWGNTENISIAVDYSADENVVVSGTDLLAIERLTP